MEEYCWAMTQAVGLSCFRWGSGVLEFGFRLNPHVRTYSPYVYLRKIQLVPYIPMWGGGGSLYHSSVYWVHEKRIGAMKSVQVQTTGKHFFAYSATLNKYPDRSPWLRCSAKHIYFRLPVKFLSFRTVTNSFCLSLHAFCCNNFRTQR